MDKSSPKKEKQKCVRKQNPKDGKTMSEWDREVFRQIDELAKTLTSPSIKVKKVADGLVLKGFSNEPHLVLRKQNLETVAGTVGDKDYATTIRNGLAGLFSRPGTPGAENKI